jgi:methylase of polypeptide subunit release factors
MWEVVTQAVVRQHPQVRAADVARGVGVSTAELRTTSFGGLTIAHDAEVLTPRAWTLHQSRWAVALLELLPDGPVLELCSGAGQIGLVVAAETTRRLVCVDVEPAAARYTRDNAVAAGVAGRVEVRLGPMAAVLGADEQFPLILADPPWVSREDVVRFPEDPVRAIDGGPGGGLDVARECLDVIGAHLTPDGQALLQLGAVPQVDALAPELTEQALEVRETRVFGDRGVLVLLSRRASQDPAP